MRNFSSKKQIAEENAEFFLKKQIAEENAEFFLKKRILMDLQLK